MTNNVLQICPSCAANNQGEWKNPRNTAPLFLGVCGVCKEITPCTHVQFWKNIRSDQTFKTPEEIKKVKPKAKPQPKPQEAPKAEASQSELLG